MTATLTTYIAEPPRSGHVCPLHHFERVRPFGRGSVCPRCLRDQQLREQARAHEAARASREQRLAERRIGTSQ